MGTVVFVCPGGFAVDIYLNQIETVSELGEDSNVRSSWAVEEEVKADGPDVYGTSFVHVSQGALNRFCGTKFVLVKGQYELQATVDKDTMYRAWVSDGMPSTWTAEWQE